MISGMFGQADNEPNRWVVTSFEDFKVFSCPECDFKDKNKMMFIMHAYNNHPKSEVSLNNLDLQNASSNSNPNIKQETDEIPNPWIVSSLEDFKCFSCPDCDLRCVTKAIFIKHAVTHPKSSQLLESLVVGLLDTPRAEVSLKSKGAKQSATSSTQTHQDSTDDDIAIISVVPKNSVTPTTQQENVTESEDISTIMEPIEFEDVKSKNEEKNCEDTKSTYEIATSGESDTTTSDESDSDNNDELGNSESEESDEFEC